ncbi:Transmembrane protein TauE like protein [Gossypium australe]|uniref:Transmembrane protein TauE like protein n=1 Tax=Gossypium australe TaxID=47621 RepID=A0A5B6UM45_9ROSI|nr:Transmembrane protein TauE like protein [Gossypium australe]
MARFGIKRDVARSIMLNFINFGLAFILVSAERSLKNGESSEESKTNDNYFVKAIHFLWKPDQSGYHHVWPEMKFNWQSVLGTCIGFCGAAFGSVGGVGGGGIFVPMLSLIVGFDPKSATAISKCMIMGAATSTVYYNLKLRHPTLDMPIIDYDLALLIQPMLMLGISIGVAFNVIFADWMVTVLLIILFVGTSTKAFFKGVETWKKETILKQVLVVKMWITGLYPVAQTLFLRRITQTKKWVDCNPAVNHESEFSKNLFNAIIAGHCFGQRLLERTWASLFCLVCIPCTSDFQGFVSSALFTNHTTTCSVGYWVLNLLQIPVSVAVSAYEAVSLYKGNRAIASKGEQGSNFQAHQLVSYCFFGVLAGIVGGLLGLGGGFIMGPLFLELGIPPQVSSATATFAMTFSSSMSVVEYYLLKRFPVPYALYFTAVATFAAFVGQHVVRRLIIVFGRASLIIFILAFTIFVSAVSLGGVGISNMIDKIHHNEYMGFENLCKYES